MKKRNIITFIIVFGIAILSTIFFLKPHYSIDTIEFLKNGYDSYIQSKFLVDGRIFSVLLLKIVIGMPMQYVIPILYVIGILISCIAVMYIRKWIIKYVKSEDKLNIMPTLIAYVIVFNFMYIDTFQFMEFPIIALSVLLNIMAGKILVEKKDKYILKSFLLILISMFCYQGTINAFIATTFVMSIIEMRKLNKDVILDMVKVGIISLIAIGINYCFIRMIGENDRINLNIIQSLRSVFLNLFIIIFSSGNHYPKYLQLIFVAVIIVCCFRKKVKMVNLLWIYLVSIMINAIVLFSGNVGIIGEKTIQYGRIFFTAGALIGYIFMYLWCISDEIRSSRTIEIIIAVYFLTILITYFQYTYLYMKGQYIDEYIIENIDEIISKYENETGDKIEKYSYKIDFDNYEILDSTYILGKQYNQMNYATIFTGRRTKEYISSELFLLYADRKIEKVYIDSEIWKERYIEDIDFSQLELFDERRFIFVGDTVYFIL